MLHDITNKCIIYADKCNEMPCLLCKSHIIQHWLLSNSIHTHNICFGCLFLALLQHLNHSFNSLSLNMVFLQACYNFSAIDITFQNEVLGSSEVCGSVTALIMPKTVPIG